MNRIPIRQHGIHKAALAVVKVLELDEREGVELADALVHGKYIRIHGASRHQLDQLREILGNMGVLME